MDVQVGDKVSMVDMTRGGVLVDVTVLEVWADGAVVIVEHDRSQGPLPLKRWRTHHSLLLPRDANAEAESFAKWYVENRSEPRE